MVVLVAYLAVLLIAGAVAGVVACVVKRRERQRLLATRGSGSNRAENNTYGWTSDDAVVIGSGGALVCVRCGVGRGC